MAPATELYRRPKSASVKSANKSRRAVSRECANASGTRQVGHCQDALYLARREIAYARASDAAAGTFNRAAFPTLPHAVARGRSTRGHSGRIRDFGTDVTGRAAFRFRASARGPRQLIDGLQRAAAEDRAVRLRNAAWRLAG